ncbi:2-dehydro-3-deoxygalactonokinase [Candidatus Laterigemmans baculatus]|uniref:2-dehydro-3-deoxygalactonokinase n=1 Tax=Candidatus Laterigemmans baculatus TaxID=2770505 RepID=UPI0013D94B4B|nr:2-dehydro-3-deoxygalactonokinase [Candidatus Laterigemmans baculatus]
MTNALNPKAALMNDYFFNCDWGTSRLRLRLVNLRSGGIVAARSSDQGAAKLAAQSTAETRGELFARVLQQHLDEFATSADARSGVDARINDAPVLISGMASSSLGWCELPYARLPFSLEGRDLVWRRLDASDEGSREPSATRPIYLCSGVRSDCDVMRGEETELLGLGILLPDLLRRDQTLVILPGTHSKHVEISAGRIVDFHTHMTGELYELLGSSSSLRHPLKAAAELSGGAEGCEPISEDDRAAFREGVKLSRQLDLTAALFQVRVRQLLHSTPPSASAATLSGILIGSELGSLAKQRPGNARIVLCASPSLCERYRAAFDSLGWFSRVEVVPPGDVERLSALGQMVALRHLQPNASPQDTRA